MKKYHLRYGRGNYGICPQCGRRSFVFYVDRSNKKINRYVGRCNYSNDCRYHYRPCDYFADCSSRMATQENTVENPDMDNMPF